MKIVDILATKDLLEKLSNSHFNNYSTVRKLAIFKKKFSDEFQWYVEEELKLVNKYVKRDKDNKPIINNGNIEFDNEENKNKFATEVNELRLTELEDFEKFKFKFSDLKDEGNETFTPNEIITLESIIDWED